MFMSNHCSEMRNANADVATKSLQKRARVNAITYLSTKSYEGTLNQNNCEFVKLNW